MDSLCIAFLVLCKYFLSFISIDLKSVKMHFLGNLQSIWFDLKQIRVCEICKSFNFYSHSIPTFFGTGVVDHILVTLCLLLQFFKCVHFALVIILKKMWFEQIVRLGICCVDWQVCQVRWWPTVTHQLHPNNLSTKLDFLVSITGRSSCCYYRYIYRYIDI